MSPLFFRLYKPRYTIFTSGFGYAIFHKKLRFVQKQLDLIKKDDAKNCLGCVNALSTWGSSVRDNINPQNPV